MGLSRDERRGLQGIAVAAVVTAGMAYYHWQSAWALAVGLLIGAVLAAGKWGGRWLAHRDLFGLGTIITLLLAALFVYGLVHEIQFGAKAVSGTARVEGFTPSGHTRVVHEVEGRPVRAVLRTRFSSLEEGSEVPILYVPEEPAQVELDSLPQRFLWPVLLLLFFGGAAAWQVVSFFSARRKRRQGQPENLVNAESGPEQVATSDRPPD